MSDRVLSSSNSIETITNNSSARKTSKRVKRKLTMGSALGGRHSSAQISQTNQTNSEPINDNQIDSTVNNNESTDTDNTNINDNTNSSNSNDSNVNSSATSNEETNDHNNTDSNVRREAIAANDTCIDLTDDSSNFDDSEVQFITAITGDLRALSSNTTGRHRSRHSIHRSRRRARTRSRTPITRPADDQQIETLDITNSPINDRTHSPTGDDISDTQNLEPCSKRVQSRRIIKCPICLDEDSAIGISGRQLVSTTCGHVFCDRCITEVIRTTKSCPNCRKKITSRRNYHPIYI